MTIAVTGATGGLGGRVARALASRGIEQRLLVRDPSRAPELPHATVAAMSYADDALAAASLTGVDTLLMVSAAESADRLEQHRAFVDAAAAAGVRHVVYTSFYGAGPDCTFTLGRDHWATEEHLRAAGPDFTFLRDSFYLDFLPALVGEDDVIRGPAGEGRVAAVARDDIAASAVSVLLAPDGHRGATYDLTGPEALTFAAIAELLARHTGRPVTFHDETVEEAYASRRRWKAPDWQYDAWVSTYTAIARGELAGVTDHVERLTGRSPIGLAAYLSRAGGSPT
ncbi:SDR family oxidoreductase [Nocardioides sp. R1-1]|uniref:SDR family oxidoreductase n=1 Tax=Nocardioides sp. R1-1 TaxID=3383502 RepID=UPI0038D14F40